MKNTVRMIISLVVVLSTLLLAVGCSSGAQNTQTVPQAPQATQPAQPAQPVKLTVWINGRDSLIGPTEQTLPQDQWYISQAITRFEAANPGITVELVVQSDALQAHQTFRTAGLAGNAPDIANLWAGTFIFALRDVTQDITTYIPQADRDNLIGWDTVTLDFKNGNPIIGYPSPDNQMALFQNKEQFRRLFEND